MWQLIVQTGYDSEIFGTFDTREAAESAGEQWVREQWGEDWGSRPADDDLYTYDVYPDKS